MGAGRDLVVRTCMCKRKSKVDASSLTVINWRCAPTIVELQRHQSVKPLKSYVLLAVVTHLVAAIPVHPPTGSWMEPLSRFSSLDLPVRGP
ncbi:Uncharacterized protein HZ326_0661 [Fusarium oxysporum f. sp. albedinis]|nr:Uncharacterized protein HZ326_0661 [Fusarium oxysporum f. sp. albedinis]